MNRRLTTRSRGRILHNANVAVHKLPVELLSDVFLIAYSHSIEGYADLQYLLSITSVCKEWRELALECPLLWTNISVSTDFTGRVFEMQLHRLKGFLIRSKDASLWLEIDVYNDANKTSNKKLQRIFNIVHPHLARCRDISIIFFTENPSFEFLPFHGPLERLESFYIHAGRWYSKTEGKVLIPVFTNDCLLPRIKRMTIMGIITALHNKLPPTQLTQLLVTSSKQTWKSNIDLISKCSALQELSLIIKDIYTNPFLSSQAFTLHDLKSLSVVDDLSFGFTSLISTPVLEKLTIIQSPWMNEASLGDSIVHLPKLRSLIVIGVVVVSNGSEDTWRQNLRRLFQALPELEHVEFEGNDFNKVIAAILIEILDDDDGNEATFTSMTSPAMYVPNLKTLILKGPSLPRPMKLVPLWVVRSLLNLRPTLRVECNSRVLSEWGHPNDLHSLGEEFCGRFCVVQE